jgi:hypothetical protein
MARDVEIMLLPQALLKRLFHRPPRVHGLRFSTEQKDFI